jgi:hypothetical protein
LVTIPDSVTSIGDGAFSNNSLSSVIIGDSVTSIGNSAFFSNLLELVTIPNSVTSIGDSAFASNSLTSVTVPNSVTRVAAWTFAFNSLTSVTIPASVKTIGEGAFDANKLTSVTIPNSVTSIGSWAFYVNSLTSVTIPNSVETIGDYVFDNNPALTSVTFAGAAPGLGVDSLGANTVQVYHYAKYGQDAFGLSGFGTPTWEEYDTNVLPTTALVVSLDLGLNVGDTVADVPVEIVVEGLLVGSAYTVVVRSTPTTITSGNATNTGTVSDSSGRMPSGLAPGAHTVTFTGTDADGNAVSRVAYVTVSDTGTVTYLSYTAAESLTLAETGFGVAPFGGAALLLLAAGVVLMLRRRRVAA